MPGAIHDPDLDDPNLQGDPVLLEQQLTDPPLHSPYSVNPELFEPDLIEFDLEEAIAPNGLDISTSSSEDGVEDQVNAVEDEDNASQDCGELQDSASGSESDHGGGLNERQKRDDR